jgi:hypothetical protein
MSQKGTKNGTEKEICFTKILNKKDNVSYWNDLGIYPKNNFAIRIVKQKFGELNNAKIWPKADIFIATGTVKQEILVKKDYFLDENDFDVFNLKPVSFSGISVKDPDSDQYQITKISPNTFKKIFGNNILASGASIYCNNPKEFVKNIEVLKGWNVDKKDFLSFFNKKLNLRLNNITDLNSLDNFKKIKKYSNEEISNIILNNKKVSDIIFLGIGNFEEPFTARWLYSKGALLKNKTPKFTVTTGSGRSKGDFTIVLKPVFSKGI